MRTGKNLDVNDGSRADDTQIQIYTAYTSNFSKK
ncbi:hypothetical protein C8N37_101852 [Sphingobacterium faecium]|nr:hypothetical protein C8N37_101852 [Sphingobacterium faecium]